MTLYHVLAAFLVFSGGIVAARSAYVRQQREATYVELTTGQLEESRQFADDIADHNQFYRKHLRHRQLRVFWLGIWMVLLGNGLFFLLTILGWMGIIS